MKTTDNLLSVLVNIYDKINWLDDGYSLLKAENTAFLSYAHWVEVNNEEQADKAWKKYKTMAALCDTFRSAPEDIEYVPNL